MKLTHKYLVRVNYKSGNSEEFWCWEFKYKFAGASRSFDWERVAANDNNCPLVMNLDEIESVWNVKRRLALRMSK